MQLFEITLLLLAVAVVFLQVARRLRAAIAFTMMCFICSRTDELDCAELHVASFGTTWLEG